MTTINKNSQKQLIIAAFLGTVAFIAYKALIIGPIPVERSYSPPANNKSGAIKKKPTKVITKEEKAVKAAKKAAILRAKEKSRKAAEKLEVRKKAVLAALHEQNIKKEFKKKAYLDINLPSDFHYEEINLDTGEDFILHGRAKKGESEFSVVASEKTPSKAQLLKMLRSGIGEIPNIGQGGLKSLFEVEKGPAGPGSGLKGFTLFAGKNSKGQETFVALAPRSDGKGTYLFILSADQEYVDKKEGTFEKLQSSIKALSP